MLGMYRQRHAPKNTGTNKVTGRVVRRDARTRGRPARSPFERAAEAAEKVR